MLLILVGLYCHFGVYGNHSSSTDATLRFAYTRSIVVPPDFSFHFIFFLLSVFLFFIQPHISVN